MTLKEKYPKGFKTGGQKEVIGKNFIVKANLRGQHSFIIGSSVRVSQVYSPSSVSWYMVATDDRGYQYNIYPEDLEACGNTIEELTKSNTSIDEKIAELIKEKELNSSKIEFMKEQGLTEYNENIFKTYHILKTLKKNSTDIEKAKAIAQIIN